MLKDAEHRRCRTTKRLDLFLMFGKQRNNPASCACSLICSIPYPN
jgi:hypothetical protein